ncbi:MAG: YtxH domain-containing protein [Elusimicrobiota bacterium]|nr:YtxH domain-containing protein [Elusimicrobiota bacterium]
MTENKNRYTMLLAAFIAGGLTGAALAILFAPRAGEEIRSKLGGLLETLKEKAGEAPAGDALPAADMEQRGKLAEQIRRRKEKLFGKAGLG